MASGTSDPTGHADITTLLLDSQFNAIVLFLSGDSYESCRLIVDRGNSSLLVINDFHLMNIIQRKYRATSKAGTLYLFNKKSCPQNDHVRLGQ
jgi:hypothetical protein